MNKRISQQVAIACLGIAAFTIGRADTRMVPIPLDDNFKIIIPVDVGAAISSLTLADAGLDSCLKATAAENGWTNAGDVTALTCTNDNIRDLTGIEQFTHLRTLNLSGNALIDISPLKQLSQLNTLDVSGSTQILSSSDIVQVNSLVSLSTLTVSNDPAHPITSTTFKSGFGALRKLTIFTATEMDPGITSGIYTRWGSNLDLAVEVDPTVITSQTVTGSTPSSFSVDPSGAATYSIPIVAPPGSNGMAPKLALHYNSHAEDGLLGAGWSLSGFSAITNCPRTFEQDGIAGTVFLDGDDRYCLDGQRLIAIKNYEGSGLDVEYRTEIDSGISVFEPAPRIYPAMCSPDGVCSTPDPSRFYMSAKDGLKYEYSAIIGGYVHPVSSIADRNGNTMLFSYVENSSTSQYYPSRIDYTANDAQGLAPYSSVRFVYETRPDPRDRYVSGRKIRSSVRMTRIRVYEGSNVIREYRLDYTTGAPTGYSLLNSVTECDSSLLTARCLPPITFAWSKGAVSWASAVSAGDNTGFANAISMDVNGDGKTDLVSCASETSKWSIQLSNGSSLDDPLPPTIACTNYQYARQIDFNSDGKMDLLVPYANSRWYLLRSNGTGFAPVDLEISNSGYQYNPLILEINGDGRPDLLYLDSTSGVREWRFRLNDGSTFGQEKDTNIQVNASYDGSHAKAVDTNGDGRMEVIGAIYDQPCVTGGCIPPSDLWFIEYDGNTYIQGQKLRIDSNVSNVYNAITQIMDINGDGRSDFLTPGVNTADTNNFIIQWRVLFNTGNGFSAPKDTGIFLDAASNNADIYHNYRRVDYNSDGRMDLLTPDPDGHWHVLQSTGTTLTDVDTNIAYTGYKNNPQVMDINGDGQHDLLLAYNNVWNLRLHAGTVPDQMTAAIDSLGARTDITYKPLTDDSVYTPAASATFPQQLFQGALRVVSQTSQNNGIGGTYKVDYAYEGGKTHLQGRGWLGFSKVTALDKQTLISTVTSYSQSVPFIGQKTSQKQRLNNLDMASTTWTPTGQPTQVTGTALKYYKKTTESITQKDFKLPGGNANLVRTVDTDITYDGYGNPKSTASQTYSGTSGIYSSVTTVVYSNDPLTWIVGRPTSVTIKNTIPTGESATRKKAFTYLDNGQLETETIEPNNATRWLTTTYTYDGFGNRKTSKVTGPDITARTTTTKWDTARGRFLEQITDAAGNTEKRTYDARFGAVKTLTDPNNLITRYYYDNFGRKNRENSPDGTETTWSYAWCNGCNAAANYYVISATTGGMVTTNYHDILNREIRNATVSLDGRAVYEDTVYNSLAQTWKKSRPYFVGDAVYSTVYAYDELGRVETETAPDTGVSTWTYAGLTTTFTNARLKSSTQIHDVLGQLIQSKDEALNSSYFTYDPFGNRTESKDAYGNKTLMGYDVRGQHISTDDPDMGQWQYQYNAADELVYQKNAKLQESRYTYDALGRLKTRTEPEGTTTWTWDTAPNGKGKLHTVTSPWSVKRTYAYDTLGRESGTTTSLGSTAFTMATTYDGNSRVSTIAYPTLNGAPNYTVTYGYDWKGYPTHISDSNGTLLWQLGAVAADDKPTLYWHDNDNVAVVRQYYPKTGLVKGISTGVGASSSMQNLTYSYDLMGNLESRTDANQNLTESFIYDDLNRLTDANLAGVATKSYRYNKIGNITFKSDVGNYSYDNVNAGPHAVTAAGTRSYTYDANGNQLTGDGRTLTWRSFDKPLTISRSGVTDTFIYDADHSRLRKTNASSETIYIGSLYEQIKQGTTTTYKFYVPTGSGEVVALASIKNVNGVWEALETRYLLKDHLGSTDVILKNSTVEESTSFDASGKRRQPNWRDGTVTSTQTRGFTGHEHDDELGLVNMNAREYDPVLGRFISPDSMVQYPDSTQGYNRYTYVNNNPLSRTDMSGHFEDYLGSDSWGSGPGLNFGSGATADWGPHFDNDFSFNSNTHWSDISFIQTGSFGSGLDNNWFGNNGFSAFDSKSGFGGFGGNQWGSYSVGSDVLGRGGFDWTVSSVGTPGSYATDAMKAVANAGIGTYEFSANFLNGALPGFPDYNSLPRFDYTNPRAGIGMELAFGLGIGGVRTIGGAWDVAKGGVQANRQVGKAAEEFLHGTYGGGPASMNTSQGWRYLDNLSDGIARESKVGRTSLGPRIQLQIQKDSELLNSGRVDSLEWHFFPGKTGTGPTGPLRQRLEGCGISVCIHP